MTERTEAVPVNGSTPTSSGSLSAEPGKDASQDDIVADIEETREQLRSTVDSLSSKLDVKGNAAARIAETKQSVAAKISDASEGARAGYQRTLASKPVTQVRAKPAVPAGAAVAVVVVVVVGLVLWRRQR